MRVEREETADPPLLSYRSMKRLTLCSASFLVIASAAAAIAATAASGLAGGEKGEI
jgi:hypothetical protein